MPQVTQRDITKNNLAIESLQDEVDSLRESFRSFEEMPKEKQERLGQLDQELMEARSEQADLALAWKTEQRKNGAVQGRLPVGAQENASELYTDEYGFDKYTRMSRGRLMNFENNREGFKRAELAGAVFLARGQNANPKMRQKALDILSSGEHDTRVYDFDNDGNVTGQVQQRDLTSAVESLGSVLVPTILEASIFSLMENYGILAREAEVRPMAGAKMKWPRRGKAIVGGWTIESLESEFDKNMDFSSFELDAKDYFIFAGVPNQLMQDSIAPIGDFIMGQMGWRQAYDWDKAGLQGVAKASTGNISGLFQQFQEFIPGTSTANPGLVVAANGSASNWDSTHITDANLFKLRGTPRLFSNNMSNWKWYCTNQFFNEVMLPRMGTAQFGWEVTFGDGKVNMQVGAQRFMGFEVVIVPGPLMPTAPGGSAEIVCMLGDMSLSTTMGIRLGAEFMATPLAGRAWFTYSTYIRMVMRGDIVNHDTGLTTYDPENNHIAGPIAALITHS
jgi:HK97 family phage major capsid protein